MEATLERDFISPWNPVGCVSRLDLLPAVGDGVGWGEAKVVVPQSLLWSFMKIQMSILETYLPRDSHSGGPAQGLEPPLRIKASPSFMESLSMRSSNLWSHTKVHSDFSCRKLKEEGHATSSTWLGKQSQHMQGDQVRWIGQEQVLVHQESITQQETSSQFFMEYCLSDAVRTPLSLLINFGNFWSV